MAKMSAINKNNKRIKLSDKFYKKRLKLKKIIMDKKLSLEERFKAQQKLSKLPRNSAKVKGINMVKKHVKTTKEKKGGIVSKENFIHLSNLAIFNTKNKNEVKK